MAAIARDYDDVVRMNDVARRLLLQNMTALPEVSSELLDWAIALWRRWRGVIERLLQWVFPALLVAFIGYSLYRIGLGRVWAARPRALAFYLTLLVPFFLPSLGDLVIFRKLLKSRRLSFNLFLRKQCLNSTVLDFSGDAYFFLWCRKNLGLPNRGVLHAIKDSNILSAAASLAVLGIALVGFAVSGTLKAWHVGLPGLWALVSVATIPAFLAFGLVIGGRRVTMLTRLDMAATFGVHLIRVVAVLFFRFLMWYFSGALPSAFVCFEFVMLGLLVTRLPMVPNKGLIYAGAAIVTAGVLNLPQAAVAAVVVTGNLTEQILTAAVALPWFATRFVERRKSEAASRDR